MTERDDERTGEVLTRLAAVIEARRGADPDESYVASLLAGEQSRLLKKIGEEAVELVLALRDGDRDAMTHEAADLWFHTLVALAGQGVDAARVIAELERRFARSGLEEKASRGD